MTASDLNYMWYMKKEQPVLKHSMSQFDNFNSHFKFRTMYIRMTLES